jgi:proteasome lid subunit RPN8/RPN11
VTLRLQRAALDEIDRQAMLAYPRECCGVVLSVGGNDEVRPIANIQDRLHAEDPIRHPRDATIAYFMEPRELYVVLRESEELGHAIRVFYHSHPDHGAYFSAEDAARAMAWDEPAYPGACYVVISVIGGSVAERLAVAWDPGQARFAPIELEIE